MYDDNRVIPALCTEKTYTERGMEVRSLPCPLCEFESMFASTKPSKEQDRHTAAIMYTHMAICHRDVVLNAEFLNRECGG